MTHEEYALECERNGNLKENYVYVAEQRDRLRAENEELKKHGKWEICCDGYYPFCSICMNEPQGRIMTKYCPNCGAKMDGGVKK